MTRTRSQSSTLIWKSAFRKADFQRLRDRNKGKASGRALWGEGEGQGGAMHMIQHYWKNVTRRCPVISSVEAVFIRDHCVLSTEQLLVNRGFKRCFKRKHWCQLTQISLRNTVTARRKADSLQPVSPNQINSLRFFLHDLCSMLGCVTQQRALALSRRSWPPELHLQETSSLFTHVTAD